MRFYREHKLLVAIVALLFVALLSCFVVVPWWNSWQEASRAQGYAAGYPAGWTACEIASQPASVMVTGAGDEKYNGVYTKSGTYNAQPAYVNDNGLWLYLYGSGPGGWALGAIKGAALRYASLAFSDPPTLPANPWSAASGASPAPTVTIGDGLGLAPKAAAKPATKRLDAAPDHP